MELPTAFGLGFEHTIPEWQFGPGARTYGHNGSGGSLGLVDPDAGVSLGYAMNRLWWGPDRTDPAVAPDLRRVVRRALSRIVRREVEVERTF